MNQAGKFLVPNSSITSPRSAMVWVPGWVAAPADAVRPLADMIQAALMLRYNERTVG